MLVRELLDMLDAIKPTEIPDTVKMRWINDVEGRVFCEITGRKADSLKPLLGENERLSVPDAYSEVYLLYLLAMSELSVGNIAAYESLRNSFDEALHRYAKYAIRNKYE